MARPASARSRALYPALDKEQGRTLLRQSKAYASEDRARTWKLLGITLAVVAAFEAGAVAPLPLGARVLCTVLAGLTMVRLFIFYHDYLHGAVFRGSFWGGAILRMIGLFMLNPPPFWKEAHDFHHHKNAKLGILPGSIPLLDTYEYARSGFWKRVYYRIARNPLNLAFAYFTVFIASMCLIPCAQRPRAHWQGLASVGLHFGIAGVVTWHSSLVDALLTVVGPAFVAAQVGAYLFYVQHNVPGLDVPDEDEWDFVYAALWSSSMLDLPRWMHWFTGNIGYHHVHHINHRIPFYRLPEAMAGLEPLQRPVRTSLRPRDVWGALSVKLWDPERRSLVGWPSPAAREACRSRLA